MRTRTSNALLVVVPGLVLLASATRCEPASRAAKPDQDPAVARVDGQRALGYVRDIAAFGPRHPGTPGAEKTRQYIARSLGGFGLKPKRHDFTALTPHPVIGRVAMANLTVDIPGRSGKAVLLGGHFDGKMIDAGLFVGANDGGSSTALLLELARTLARTPPPCPVRIAFFDGEEALVAWSDSDSLYGSKQMAAEMRRQNEVDRFAAAVIVDMIGDRHLRLSGEAYSSEAVVRILEATGRRLGHSAVFGGPRRAIEDDHVPFLQIGIPAAVLIDLDYGPGWDSNAFWHTPEDTVDKLSAESIEIIGQVVLESLPALSALAR